MFENDKENSASTPLRCNGSISKDSNARSGKAFGRLLKDATNQVRTEYDTKVAVDFTVNEALGIMNDWVRETKDQEVAAKIATQEEEAERKRKEASQAAVKDGEAAALRVAIEETRRMKAEAKVKVNREQADADLAKSIYDADEKARHEEVVNQFKLLHEDEKLARQLSDNSPARTMFDYSTDSKGAAPAAEDKAESTVGLHDDAKSASKSCDVEEEYVEEKEDEEKEDDDREADEDVERIVREASRRFEQLDKDLQAAEQTQRELDKEHERQQEKDFQLSCRLAVKTEREAHRLEKYREVQRDFAKCQRDDKTLARMWEEAEADVEDVCEAVCITLLLPNIINLSVKVIKNGRKVAIDATRIVKEGDKHASPVNTQYLAHFAIQGRNVRIQDKDVTHDYASDTGLLHIYLEGVSLNDNEATTVEDRGNFDYEDAFGAAEGDFSAEGNNNQSTSKKVLNKAQRMTQAMKNGFMRLMGK